MAPHASESTLEGILNVELVPGTEIMTDVGNHHFAKSRRQNIVLVPQPSSDPRDPLNWSPAWKFAAISSMLVVVFVQVLGPLAISPVFPQLMHDFDASLDEVIQFTGITILLLGFGNWFWVPLSDTFGRRPALILAEIMTIVGAAWRATATSYHSFYGASGLLGIGTGIAIQPAIIADVTFLHERGLYNTLFFATFFVGVILGPILQGVMAQNSGWRSFWWLNMALNCFGLLVVLIAYPETMWARKSTDKAVSLESEVPNSSEKPDQSEKKIHHISSGADNSTLTNEEDQAVVGSGSPCFRQFWPLQPNRNPFKKLAISFFTPFRLLALPIIVWAAVVQAWSSSCYLSITFVQAVAFGAPPYSFSTQSIGFVNFATLVGALIGLFTAGPLSDWLSMRLTVLNNGVREPEMRLPTMIPYAALMILGNFVIGFGLEYKWDWRAIVIIGYGCAGIQATALSSIASTYAIDSYTPVAAPIFVIVTLARDLWGYGMSHFIAPWTEESGYVQPFMLNMCLLSLWLIIGGLFYFYGKKVRKASKNSWVHRYVELAS